VPKEWPIRQASSTGGVVVHHASATALARVDTLLTQARQAGLGVWRLSVRRAEPHFQLHVPLPDRARPAREFFEAVHGLSELALK
jgi:hypothetical protein